MASLYCDYKTMSLSKLEEVASGQSSTVKDAEAMPPIMPAFPDLSIGGLKIPAIFDVKWVERMKDTVKLRPDDIWIVTYPKCGTTWTIILVNVKYCVGRA